MSNLEPALELARNRMFLTEDDVVQIAALVDEAAEMSPFGLHVVDLGAGSGTTALSVLCADPSAIITTVDRDPAAVDWARLAIQNVFPRSNWVGVVADAAEAASAHQTPKVGLLLHDAGHEQDDVLGDLTAWLPQMLSGALVWVHDYRKAPWQDEWYPGVARAVRMLVEQGSLEEIGPSGLGWIGRKP